MGNKGISYKDSGVDLHLGDSFVDSLKTDLKQTFDENVMHGVGLFGAMYNLKQFGADQVLVSSVDGVGTKLRVAFMSGRHDTVGNDLVNHCVDDIIVQGATPLFFMDYISFSQLEAKELKSIMTGFINGCRENHISLIGGETAQMPGFYQPGEYDLVGFITGIVRKQDIITGRNIRPGDVLLGLPSNGLHTNGYSLARKVLFEQAGLRVDTLLPEYNQTVADVLLAVHTNYLADISRIREAVALKGMAHITGGGIPGNLVRILPAQTAARIRWSAIEVPPIFHIIQKHGNVALDEMRRTFNMGIGMIIVLAPEDVDKAVSSCADLRELGRVESLGRAGRIIFSS